MLARDGNLTPCLRSCARGPRVHGLHPWVPYATSSALSASKRSLRLSPHATGRGVSETVRNAQDDVTEALRAAGVVCLDFSTGKTTWEVDKDVRQLGMQREIWAE